MACEDPRCLRMVLMAVRHRNRRRQTPRRRPSGCFRIAILLFLRASSCARILARPIVRKKTPDYFFLDRESGSICRHGEKSHKARRRSERAASALAERGRPGHVIGPAAARHGHADKRYKLSSSSASRRRQDPDPSPPLLLLFVAYPAMGLVVLDTPSHTILQFHWYRMVNAMA